MMKTFKEFYLEEGTKDVVVKNNVFLFHFTPVENLKSIIQKGGLTPSFHSKAKANYYGFAEVSRGRVHMSATPDTWLHQFGSLDISKMVLFRLKKQYNTKYKWVTPEYMKRRYQSYDFSRKDNASSQYYRGASFVLSDVFTSKTIPLKHLEVFNNAYDHYDDAGNLKNWSDDDLEELEFYPEDLPRKAFDRSY